MIHVHAVASDYTKTIYIIFNENEYVDKYELYRNGQLIAETAKDSFGDFKRPTMFDNDHHTNLFVKNSNHELMYEDAGVDGLTYSYYVKYYHGDNAWNSNTVYIGLH